MITDAGHRTVPASDPIHTSLGPEEPRPEETGAERTWCERRFRAMGTEVHVVVVGPDCRAISTRTVDRITDLERRWSRFLETSETSRLNAAGGRPMLVSEPTFELLERAVTGWQLTEGRFDPFMQPAMALLGYDQSFESFDWIDGLIPPARVSTGASGIQLEPSQRLVRLPKGVGFDPGAIGKGFAADRVSREAMIDGAEGVLVNIGGDLRVRGCSPDDTADRVWLVAIREPSVSPTSIAMVRLANAGLATSTVCRRRWRSPEGERHHVLDPSTCLPTGEDAVLVSVIAGDAWWAEVAATALLVQPAIRSAAAAADLDIGVPALTVRSNGVVKRSGGFDRWEL